MLRGPSGKWGWCAEDEREEVSYFGIGIYHTKNSINVGTLWRSASSMGAAFIFTIGRRYSRQGSDTLDAPGHVPLFSYLSFDEFFKTMPSRGRLVGVELDDAATPIMNFAHPEQAVYLLGAEDNGLPFHVLSRCHSVIQLPGHACLNVAVAGSIVIFDRISKASATGHLGERE